MPALPSFSVNQDRLAALVPPLRVHRHRYCGVLAPNSPLRAAAIALAVPAVVGLAASPLSVRFHGWAHDRVGVVRSPWWWLPQFGEDREARGGNSRLLSDKAMMSMARDAGATKNFVAVSRQRP